MQFKLSNHVSELCENARYQQGVGLRIHRNSQTELYQDVGKPWCSSGFKSSRLNREIMTINDNGKMTSVIGRSTIRQRVTSVQSQDWIEFSSKDHLFLLYYRLKRNDSYLFIRKLCAIYTEGTTGVVFYWITKSKLNTYFRTCNNWDTFASFFYDKAIRSVEMELENACIRPLFYILKQKKC